jgi:hypothetical protein
MDPKSESYPAHFSRLQALDSFRLRHQPRGELVSHDQFMLLKVEYESAAHQQAAT